MWQRSGGWIPYLCDFGIATDGIGDQTATGSLVGSLSYMAPERHQGATASVAGDVYSTGCLLWAVLTGRAPYSGTDFQVMLAHSSADIPQLAADDPISIGINAVLRDALAKDPARRTPTAHALQARLRRLHELHARESHSTFPGVASGKPTIANPPAPPQPTTAGDSTSEETIRRSSAVSEPTIRASRQPSSASSIEPVEPSSALEGAPRPPEPSSSKNGRPRKRFRIVAAMGIAVTISTGALYTYVEHSDSNASPAPGTSAASTSPPPTQADTELTAPSETVECWNEERASAAAACPPPRGFRGLSSAFPGLDVPKNPCARKQKYDGQVFYYCKLSDFKVRRSKGVAPDLSRLSTKGAITVGWGSSNVCYHTCRSVRNAIVDLHTQTGPSYTYRPGYSWDTSYSPRGTTRAVITFASQPHYYVDFMARSKAAAMRFARLLNPRSPSDYGLAP